MREVHFNVDNIDYIELRPRYKAYTWYPELPKTKFLFIFTDFPAIGAGWAQRERSHRRSVESLRNSDHIFVFPEDTVSHSEYPTNGHWEKKAYVYVRAKRTDLGRYFDTDEEAKTWIKLLVEKSKHTFDVIYKD